MPAILLIDSYDSFTCNLTKQLEKVTGATVITIRNDSVSPEILVEKILPSFDAIVIGPGPGNPANPADVGVLPTIWSLKEKDLVPAFGVCLGFQSLFLAFGGQVQRLPNVIHGQPSNIHHTATSIYSGVDQGFSSIRYHSYHCLPPSTTSPLQILSWTYDGDYKVIMGGHHTSKPFWGVQYHPESICSEHGDTVLANFWEQAQKWSKVHGRKTIHDPILLQSISKSFSIKPVPLSQTQYSPQTSPTNTPVSSPDTPPPHAPLEDHEFEPQYFQRSRQFGDSGIQVCWFPIEHKISNFGHFTALICDHLKANSQEFALLNSACEPGRWSYIGVLEPGVTKTITYYKTYKPDHAFLNKYRTSGKSENDVALARPILIDDERGIWGFLSDYMAPKIATFRSSLLNKKGTLLTEAGFLGGLIGYISYEGGQADYPESDFALDPPLHADVNLIDVERTILLDAVNAVAYVISLKHNDHEWVSTTAQWLEDLIKVRTDDDWAASVPDSANVYLGGDENAEVQGPKQELYLDSIREAQQSLLSGDSYELCLTAQTCIKTATALDPWNLYKILLRKNPAPYSCFIDFDDSVLVGASPERFMSWDRTGKCEFRPIKGTVKRNQPGMTREKACETLFPQDQ